MSTAPQEQATEHRVREELLEALEGLHGPRLQTARDFAQYLAQLEDDAEVEMLSRSASFASEMREAEHAADTAEPFDWRAELGADAGGDGESAS